MAQVISWLRERLQRITASSDDRERGQVLIIVIMGIFGLLVLVGLAVDLGLYYIERVRITRAVDSATLAAAYELPMEAAARLQAIDFLSQNGYDAYGPNTELIVDGVTVSVPTSGVAKTTIYLDTAMFRDVDGSGAPISDTAYRMEIRVRQMVPVIFLRFAGFKNIACEAAAVAENVNNLDVALVFDMSGSMNDDTICPNCWRVGDDGYDKNEPCRKGTCYPLPWDGPANGDPRHCDPVVTPYNSGGEDYYLIEAEEYYDTNNSYDWDLYSFGRTYWVMQTRDSSASGRWRSIDGSGAYIQHKPETGSVTCRYEELDSNGDGFVGDDEGKCWSGAPGGPYDAPSVSYNFSPVANDTYYIWVRGRSSSNSSPHNRLFWGIDEVGDGVGVQLGWGETGNCGEFGCEKFGTGWQWRRIGDNSGHWLEAGKQYFLVFWAGGRMFRLDRIAITTYSGSSTPTPLGLHSGRGPESGDSPFAYTNGRDGYACDPCDARFAGYPASHSDRPVGFDPADLIPPLPAHSDWEQNNEFPVCETGANPDRRLDDIYDGPQPIRDSIEAAKRFVRKVIDEEHSGYKHDQVGYVRYSTNAEIASHLQCLRRLGADNCTPDDIEDTIIVALDATSAGGTTNIAGGMKDGLEVLSTGPRAACEAGSGACGRPGAIHVLIVMTDGLANQVPDNYCYDVPGREWPGSGNDNATDCVIYYAHEARNSSVIVYTITLGVAADFELMQAVADLTGGVHRNADRPEKLDKIFEELYELMYLRLIE